MQVHDVLRRRGGGPLEHLPHRGILGGDLLALGVAERMDVEQERFLDLRVVEEVHTALGRDLRVIGEEDRRGQHGVVGR